MIRRMRSERQTRDILGWLIIAYLAFVILLSLIQRQQALRCNAIEEHVSRPTMDFQHDPLHGELPTTQP